MSRGYGLPALIGLIGLFAGLPARAITYEYVHTDLQGNVVAVTDENRKVIERHEYEPYGMPQAPFTQDQPGYTGHVHDADTGLVYMQQRYYDPEVGRFLSVDPVNVRELGDNFNRYWYANNNPYTFVDPDGRETYDCRGEPSCAENINAADLKEGDVVLTDDGMVVAGADTITAIGTNVGGLPVADGVTVSASHNIFTGKHQYTITGKICSGGTAGCNGGLADGVFAHVNENDIPFIDDDLGSGDRNLIPGVFRPLGNQPIRHEEYPSLRTSINIALEGHNFYPGTVTHRVFFDNNGNLYYQVVGVGTGANPGFNNFAGVQLFIDGINGLTGSGVKDVVEKFGR